MRNFYTELSAFSDFRQVTDARNYVQVPRDWLLVLTDVQGSTMAIQQGRYRDVNLMGAAAIVAIQNVLDTRYVPFTFGGDGATILIPPEAKEKITLELLRLKNLAQQKFQISLRTGIVGIGDLGGAAVLVGKYQLAEGNFIAAFKGEGFALAEKLVKAENSEYELSMQIDPRELPDLQHLSCRWLPLHSKNGQIVALLISARAGENSEEIYTQIISELDNLIHHVQFNPIHRENLLAQGLFAQISTEFRLQARQNFLRRFFRFMIANIFTSHTLRTGQNLLKTVKIKEYLDETPQNSDYKKMDGILKMVIDCTEADLQKLRSLLEKYYLAGKIFYGLHVSQTATLTCVVHELDHNHHLHFVDGGDGGYAMAAVQLKAQVRSANL